MYTNLSNSDIFVQQWGGF